MDGDDYSFKSNKSEVSYTKTKAPFITRSYFDTSSNAQKIKELNHISASNIAQNYNNKMNNPIYKRTNPILQNNNENSEGYLAGTDPERKLTMKKVNETSHQKIFFESNEPPVQIKKQLKSTNSLQYNTIQRNPIIDGDPSSLNKIYPAQIKTYLDSKNKQSNKSPTINDQGSPLK